AREWDAVVALKGPPTAIASPTGEVYLNTTGNTALAHGGAGDVLAGIIAGLWAGGVAALEAACAGVHLHGLAADLLAEGGAERALLPGDLFHVLPKALAELES
ncbi:bifunctional ADP-dependent NAD(P)H-hydrate dehydratase/NAD(P)H-hydrate epimerase, partial [Candidatus Acetothermia bacterium]